MKKREREGRRKRDRGEGEERERGVERLRMIKSRVEWRGGSFKLSLGY